MSSKVSSVLHQHKYLIYDIYIEQNKPIKETLEALTLAGVKCSRSTLMLHMKQWLFTKYSKSEDTASLRVELGFLFWKKCLSDENILRVNNIQFW